MLGAGGDIATGGEVFDAGDGACTVSCGSAREDAGTLCCDTAACPRLPRVDAPLLGCARLGGGGDSSLSSLGIGLVRRLLRSLLPIVSMLSLLSVGKDGSEFGRVPRRQCRSEELVSCYGTRRQKIHRT